MGKKEILSSGEVKLAILLKTNQLRRDSLTTLSSDHIKKTLTKYVWRKQCPSNVHDAINDIFKLEVSTIVGFLSYDAIDQGSKMDINDINLMLKGEFYE